MGNITKKFLKSTIKDGEVFDENTRHKIAEVDGELVEMKFCPDCRKWLALDQFNKSFKQLDGYVRTCRCCTTTQRSTWRNEHEHEQEHSTSNSLDFFDIINDALNKIIEEYKGKISTLEEENKTLKAKTETTKDITKLTEREVETVLKFNSIPPRLLFDAIKRIDDRYTFTCYDNVSGLTHSIVSEESCSTNKICN